MIIRDYVIFLCIYYWKRNTDDLDPIHPALLNRSPMLKQIKICLLRNTLRHDLIVHTTIQVTRGSSEKSLHKSKRSFEWRIFSSSCGTHLLGSQTDSDKTYDPVMTSQHWSIILMKRSDLQKKECFLGDNSRNNPYTLLLLLAMRRESPSAKQQSLTGVKTARCERRWWNWTYLHDCPGQPTLLPHACHQERRTMNP